MPLFGDHRAAGKVSCPSALHQFNSRAQSLLPLGCTSQILSSFEASDLSLDLGLSSLPSLPAHLIPQTPKELQKEKPDENELAVEVHLES